MLRLAEPSRIPFFDLGRQYRELAEEIESALARVARSGAYVLGPELELFEREFAAYCGATECIGLSSGTSALRLVLEALEIGPGDDVVVPANSFVASATAVVHAGANVVLVDCLEDGTIDPARVRSALTPTTKAVVAVHLYGRPGDLDALVSLSREAGVALIEDACQAHGARYRGRRVGTLGDAAVFSLYPSKNLGALGDAGAVVTDDLGLAHRIRLARSHGEVRKYDHVSVGWNERLDDLQAAVLRIKLRRLDAWNERRRNLAALYVLLLGDGVRVDDPPPWVEPVWHLYVIAVAERDAVRAELVGEGVSVGLHYPTPIHLQPAFAGLRLGPGSFPVAEERARMLLSLPIFPELTAVEVERVCATVNRATGDGRRSAQSAR